MEVLIEKLSLLLDAPPSTAVEKASGNVIRVNQAIAEALYGTRVDWRMLANADFENIYFKDAAYKPREHEMDLTKKNVLNAVNTLNKRIPGTRVAYDVLCEFLHPNVGDVLAASLNSRPFLDRFGIRHLEHALGRGPANLREFGDVAPVLSATLRVATSIVGATRTIHQELDKLAETNTSRTRWLDAAGA